MFYTKNDYLNEESIIYGKKVCVQETEPVVQSKLGKIRGFQVEGAYTFHGIKYADAQRFQMPVEPQTASLPQWPVCEPGDEAVMPFDVKCEVRHNHDNALMELMKQVNLAFMLGQPANGQNKESVILH